MDNLFTLLEQRTSCRDFTNEKIAEEILDRILQAAVKAPSSGGFQKYSIIKIENADNKRKLAKLCRSQGFISKAAVNLVFCVDFRRIMRINEVIPAPCDKINQFSEFMMAVIDTAISAQTLCLAAETAGIASVYVGNIIYTMDRVSALLKLPQYVFPAIMVSLGYCRQKPQLSEKFPVQLLVHEEEYREVEIEVLLRHYKAKYKNWQMPVKEAVLEKIEKTCHQLQGEDFAKKCLAYIREKNSISPYQYWLGAYYLLKEDFLDFKGYQNYMKKQAFNWLADGE